MLEELRIQQLGVIEDVSLVLPKGSIAITGETGAGKTMIVGAVQLLMGGRAEPDMVRVGATEATVEGRFIDRDGTEVVARRVVPADGRSRAYIDGSLATATALQERIGPLIDLHGQHAQQSLLRPATQRHALDTYADIDTVTLADARSALRQIDNQLDDLGGDATERARRIDLLRYQLDELATASLTDPNEDEQLASQETRLSRAYDDGVAADRSVELLGADGPATEALGQVANLLEGGPEFESIRSRIESVLAELTDLASELRQFSELSVDDPQAREIVRARRQQLAELRRKYGPTLVDVMDYERDLATQLTELESHEQRVVALTDDRTKALRRLQEESARVLAQRQQAAPKLAKAITTELSTLAMPDARVSIDVAGVAGEEVAILLAPNPGLPELPIGKGASGGELSRTMLALRMVISGGPPIKVFDEVDAGIGGETGKAIGDALTSLADSQVFVVTHLPQVAACTAHHVIINKSSTSSRTVSDARMLTEDERVVEVARMLSGSPDSSSAIEHAEELLAQHTRSPSAR